MMRRANDPRVALRWLTVFWAVILAATLMIATAATIGRAIGDAGLGIATMLSTVAAAAFLKRSSSRIRRVLSGRSRHRQPGPARPAMPTLPL